MTSGGLRVGEPLSRADIRGGHPFTAIVLPVSLISEAAGMVSRSVSKQLASAGSAENAHDWQLTFAGSLRQVQRPWLGEEADILLAADVVGVSVRTLQRRLRQSGLGFSDLIQQVRFETACSLLEEPDLRLTDPAHFTGAFHRWAGVTLSACRTTQGLSAA